jgi:cell division septation protein DedD
MEADPGRDEGGREIRLEGPRLLVFAAGLAVLVLAAFLAGRWSAPSGPPPGASEDRPADSRELDRAPAQGGAGSFFDTASGPEKAAEPERQVASRSAGPGKTPSSPPPAATPGPWVVQVFAGRDREAAESVVRGLGDRGYPVRLDSEREGGDQLFKVRVGGFPSQAEAAAAAEKLKKDGNKGAWVTRAK